MRKETDLNEDGMRRINHHNIGTLYLPLAVLLISLFIIGCTTQGRLTYLTFSESDEFGALHSSMEALKIEGLQGSVQQQFSALKEVRYISKHQDEKPEDRVKREMAVSALVFLAFVSDDGDVRDRSKSRLATILEDGEEWPFFLQMAVVEGIADLAIGTLGFQQKEDGRPMRFGVDSGLREDALEFLLEKIESLSDDLQYFAVSSLRRALLAPPDLETCPVDICDADVRKNRELWEQGREVKRVVPANADSAAVAAGAYGPETKRVPIDERREWNEESDDLKRVIWSGLGKLLDNQEISLLTRSRIIRFASDGRNFSLLPEMEETFQETTAEWAQNEDIPSNLRQLLKAAQERVSLYGVPAAKPPVPSQSAFSEVWQRTADFIETHLDAVLTEQIGRQRSGLRIIGRPDAGMLAVAPFADAPDDMIKREIVLDILADVLKRGLVLENQGFYPELTRAVGNTESNVALAPLLGMVKELYPALKKRRLDPRLLLDALARSAEQSESFFRKRMYIDAIAAGAKEFPELVNLSLSSVTLDLLSRQLVENKIRDAGETL